MPPPGESAGVPGFAIALIAIPAVVIVGLVGYMLFSGGDEKPQVVENDPNKDWAAMVKGSSTLISDYKEIAKLGPEDSRRQGRLKSLQNRCQTWLDEFDEFSKPYLDEEGYLKDEYRAKFGKVKRQVNTLRVDISKQIGF